MKFAKALSVAVSIAMVGCATSSKNISSSYVSPVQYQTYDCSQLTLETQRINQRVSQLGGRLDEAASNDAAIMGVGMILFWPALFALGGTKQQEAEYARLKGEYDAVQVATIEKKCQVAAAQPVQPTPAPVAEAATAQVTTVSESTDATKNN